MNERAMDPALIDRLVELVDAMKKADLACDSSAFHAFAHQWLQLTGGRATDLHDLMIRNRIQARVIALDPKRHPTVSARLETGRAEIRSLDGHTPNFFLYITVRPAINAVAELLMYHPTERHNYEALKSTGLLVYTQPQGGASPPSRFVSDKSALEIQYIATQRPK